MDARMFDAELTIDDAALGAYAGLRQPRLDPSRYVVRKELARGGMGRVSIAYDSVLGRTVAIKELIQPRADLIVRFKRELELTARLQHPAIVNIHDGGVWTTGELAYVMRLVTGSSLADAVANAADVEARLALLPHVIAAVDALAYAHAQGIIHRDLKPANVLVGNFGETVVIDWGLAKDLGSPEPSRPPPAEPFRGGAAGGETIAGAVLGTPAYMAPEQAAGEAADARADVYALGALLYHVAAGTSPHEGASVEAVLARVIAGEIVPLADRMPDLPPDLHAIVAKAMAVDPADRYADAGELAADLKRFQAGKLVGAQHYTTWQLVRRWLHAHRAVVSIVVTAIVLVAAVGVVSLTRVLDERTRSAAAEVEARARRSEAEQLLDFMLVDLRRSLEPVGKVDLLFGVASRARDYYTRSPLLDHHAVLARHNLGDVLVAQNDHAGALAEYASGLAIAETLLALEPGDSTWQHDVAASHRLVGDAYTFLGSLGPALVEYRAAVASARAEYLATGEPGWQRELARSDLGLGHTLLAQGDEAGALVAYREALDLAQRAVAEVPADRERSRQVMIAHNRVADVLAKRDRNAALAEYRAAYAIAESLAATSADSEAQRDLSVSHSHLGFTLKKLGDRATAIAELRAAAAIDEQLVRHDPLNGTWQSDYAISKNAVAKFLLEDKDYANALAGYRETLAIRTQLAAAAPDDAAKQHDLAMSHYFVGDVLEDMGNAAGALAEYRKAVAIVDKVVEHDPTNAKWRTELDELRRTVEQCCTRR